MQPQENSKYIRMTTESIKLHDISSYFYGLSKELYSLSALKYSSS